MGILQKSQPYTWFTGGNPQIDPNYNLALDIAKIFNPNTLASNELDLSLRNPISFNNTEQNQFVASQFTDPLNFIQQNFDYGSFMQQVNKDPTIQKNIQQNQQRIIDEKQLQQQNIKNDIYSKYGSVNGSVGGKVGDMAINLGQQLGYAFSGVNFDFSDKVQNVNLGKIIGNTASGVQTGINSIKNWNSINKLKTKLGDNISDIERKSLNTARTGNAFALAGAAAGIADSFLGDKTEYSGDYGSVTNTLDSVYDGISDVAMSFGPVGMIVGGAMKGADLLGDVFNKFGGGTDGMTTADAILGSSFFSWNVGLINGFGGSRTDTISKDNEAFAQVGSSYSGTGSMVDDAVTKSGKKYGLFSKSAYNKAQSLINESKRQQNIMSGIAADAADRFAIRDSMSGINAERRNVALNGGYRQANVRVGKEGLKFEVTIEELYVPTFIEELEIPDIESFKLGGTLQEKQTPTFIEEINIEIFKDEGKTSEQEWSEDPIEYALQRFPILKNLPIVNLQLDSKLLPFFG